MKTIQDLAVLLLTSALLTVGASSLQAETPSLNLLEEKAFDYFWQTCHSNGMMPIRVGMADTLSTAGTGYQLTALCIGAERKWISREEAANGTLKILRALDTLPRFHGFWAEYYHAETGKPLALTHPLNDGGHTMATAYLTAGFITTKNYFTETNAIESEVQTLCESLGSKTEWSWMLFDQQNTPQHTLASAWSPTHGFQLDRRLTAEQDLSAMLAYLLAIASPTHSIPSTCWNNGWCTTYQWYQQGDLRFISCPPLAAHQQAHIWLNLKNRKDRQADYFRNSIAATLVNSSYALRNLYPGDNIWGISDCSGPSGFEHYGYPPLRGKVNQDATLSTAAAIGSILFTPSLSLRAIQGMQDDYREELFGEYGFYESFSPRHKWYFSGYSTLQQGIVLGMLANKRDQFVQQLFMQEESIRKAMDAVGFTSIIADFEESARAFKPYALMAPSRYYSTSLTTTSPREGFYALHVTYNKKSKADAGLKIYPAQTDFSQYSYLTFWLSDLEHVAITLTDNQNRTLFLDSPIFGPNDQDKWQRLHFKLPQNRIDLTHIEHIAFIAAPGDTKAHGEFLIDGICLANRLATSQPRTPFRFDLNASRMPGEVILSWQNLPNEEHGTPYQYHIRYSSSPMRNNKRFQQGISAARGNRIIDGTTTNLHIGGLAMGQTIYFAIQAEDLDGNLSDISDSISILLPEKRLPSEFNLEDFDQPDLNTQWESSTKAINLHPVTDVSLEGSGSLQVDYHKQGERDLWSSLTLIPDIKDIAQYNYLSMWVAGKADLILRVIDSNGNQQDTQLKKADSSDSWAPVFFDLSKLTQVDRKSIDRILLFIEPDKTNIAGTIYIDTVTLSASRQ